MSSGKESEKTTKESKSIKTPNIPLSARALLSRQLGASGPGRLPSLRPARDLSLGTPSKIAFGGKIKRTFTPTIPSRKIKEEPKDEPSKAYNQRDKQQGGEGRGRGRGRGRGGRGRGRGEIIASQSVFSMGPAEKSKLNQSTPSISFLGGERRDDKMSIKKEIKDMDYDDEESKKILNMLQTEGDDMGDEFSKYGMAPVSIPLSNYLLKIKESEDIKDEIIKEEPMDTDIDDSTEKPRMKPKAAKKPLSITTEQKETLCSSLFTLSEVEEDRFLFLQFPDKLPIKSMKKDSCLTNQPESEDQTKGKINANSTNVTLKDVSEGYIGKLQVLKSGKTRLVLGDVTLDVAMGTSCSFLQELVSVHTDENRSDMTVLGQIKHRIICTPDFEKLLVT